MNDRLRLIVYLVPPQKFVSGGVLSIFSLCNASRDFFSVHRSKVLLSVYPGFKSYGKHDLLNSDETVYSFEDIVKLGNPEYLQLHIPEYAANDVLKLLNESHGDYLKNVPDLRVNILNQNVLYMPEPQQLANWFHLTPKLTQTTAHDRYSSQGLADKYDTPLHHFSVYLDPRQYDKKSYEEKDNIIVLSPDENEYRSRIVDKLTDELPDYKLITIEKIPYKDYKELVSRAKFCVTFGEGFDGYFIEPCFSGGVTFTVYNDDFFPDKKFSTFPNVYDSYSEMLTQIVKDIKHLENKQRYEKVSDENLKKITQFYKYETYQDNLKRFYEEKFDFVPSRYSAERLLGSVVAALADKTRQAEEQETEIKKLKQHLDERTSLVADYKTELDANQKFIASIFSSYSWRITSPLRSLSARFKKSD